MCRTLTLLVIPVLVAAVASAYELDSAGGQDDLTPEMIAETDVIAKVLEDIAPEGWEPGGPVERYTPVNMYDKINGRSELFMSYDVIGMTYVGLYDKEDDARSIDVYVYDQASPLGAFGVYSVERWPGNTSVEVGRDGYRTDNDLFFWFGQYYVCILSLDSDAAIHATQLKVAKELEKRLKDSGESLWGLSVLPEEDRQEETIQYFQVDAMSIDFMVDTFTAEYGTGDESVRRFISRQNDEATATAALQKYVDYLTAYGDDLKDEEIDGVRIVSADFGGGYIDAAFTQGRYVGGVTAVKGRERALVSTTEFAKALASE